jgi:hypothetical protein
MDFIRDYVTFVIRPLPTHSIQTGMEVCENFYYKLIFWTAAFTVAFVVFNKLPRILFPRWYEGLTDRKKREFPAYAACLLHHIFMVPRAWVHIIQDFQRSPAELAVISYSVVESGIAPFCLGYLLSDTICYALPELFRGNVEFMIHHFFSTWLVTASMFSNGHLLRYIPHLLLADTSNLVFNTAWILRTVDGWKGGKLVVLLEILFSIAFLLTRVINMPLAFYAILTSQYGEELGWARVALPPIALLQWYWFTKVVTGIASRLSPPSAAEAKKGKAKKA